MARAYYESTLPSEQFLAPDAALGTLQTCVVRVPGWILLGKHAPLCGSVVGPAAELQRESAMTRVEDLWPGTLFSEAKQKSRAFALSFIANSSAQSLWRRSLLCVPWA